VIAKLERNGAFFQLLGNGEHRHIAHLHAAVRFWNVEMPKPLSLSLLLQIFHYFYIAHDHRIAAQSGATLPAAAFEYVGSIFELRFEWNQTLADKILDSLAQRFFFGR
jgi:hypothetical protein